MNKRISKEKQAGAKKKGWLSQRLVPILILLLVIAIMVSAIYFYKAYPSRIEELKAYGYLGAFIISLILNATVILPVGTFAVVATLGATLPSAPLVGLVAGVGAAIGEMTGYMAGYSGRSIVQRQKIYARLEGWVKKWGALAIFILAIVPFLFDLAGMAAGALRLPFWKFFLACWLGRTILYIVLALAGSWGWNAVLPYLSYRRPLTFSSSAEPTIK